MLKSLLIVLSVSLVVVIAVAPKRSVHGILMTNDEMSLLDATNAQALDGGQVREDKGNSFVRALKAPFKALGRFFGRGKKKNDNKLHRLSEKDVEKFEAAQITQITDATSVPETARPNPNPNASASEHLEQGRVFLNEGRMNEAMAELSLAASLDPKLAEAHNLIGVGFAGKGLPDIARQSFEKALKIDKNNAEVLNNLGYLFYANGDYKRAYDRLKKAAQLDPKNSRILNNLALTQAELGKFDDAYKNFVRAEGEVKGRINMANRLEVAGRKDEAAKHFEAAKELAQAAEKSESSPESIMVVMEVKNGLVSYAYVSNPRPSLRNYEATALRIARQKRFAPDKNGTQSMVVRVSPAPGL